MQIESGVKNMMISNEQRVTLLEVRRRLAEQSFRIFPVAPWYRRDESDFVAISTSVVRHLFVVRAVPNGTVSIRPFSSSMKTEPIAQMVNSAKHHFKARVSVWKRRLLPKTREGTSVSWLPYLEPDSQAEWRTVA